MFANVEGKPEVFSVLCDFFSEFFLPKPALEFLAEAAFCEHKGPP